MDEPHTPLNSTAQPSTYPHNSLYRFDKTRFNAPETSNALETMIRTSLVGSTFRFERPPKSKLGLRHFTLFCCHHKSTSQSTKDFSDGCYSQQGVKEEYVKRQKSIASMSNIDALANKTERKAIRLTKASKTSSYSDNQPKHCRRDQRVESKCICKLVWFESINNCFYLDHVHTNLIHTGHNYIQPSSAKPPRNSKITRM